LVVDVAFSFELTFVSVTHAELLSERLASVQFSLDVLGHVFLLFFEVGLANLFTVSPDGGSIAGPGVTLGI